VIVAPCPCERKPFAIKFDGKMNDALGMDGSANTMNPMTFHFVLA
jgi:hypothetical protein